jgi:hypothetical protein
MGGTHYGVLNGSIVRGKQGSRLSRRVCGNCWKTLTADPPVDGGSLHCASVGDRADVAQAWRRSHITEPAAALF